MLPKAERTIERYLLAGAEARLFKTLGAKLYSDLAPLLNVTDRGKLTRALSLIDYAVSAADYKMFYDHPELPDKFKRVFYGNIADEPKHDVDQAVLTRARDVADKLFER